MRKATPLRALAPAPFRPLELRLKLNKQQHELLTSMVGLGLYGRTVEDVALRLVDRGLEDFVHGPDPEDRPS